MKLIIFDFEVFKYDVLLGALIVENDNVELFQSWDTEEIKKFYEEYKNTIWVGWNNLRYDNHILQAIIRNVNPKLVSDKITKERKKLYTTIHLMSYDLMKASGGFISLKLTEGLDGEKISESEVDFELDRFLTPEERELTEIYNIDDLTQTLSNFYKLQNSLIMQLETISEFNLDIGILNHSEAMTAEKVLMAKKIPGIENMTVKPKIYDNLLIKNQELKDFFLNETFMTGKKLKIDVVGVKHTIGVGGIHGARNKYHAENVYLFDVSGYYNLIMIMYDLLPRGIPEEGKKLYKDMYYEQLELKKTNPRKRNVLKVILLSVFGSSLNKYLNFYDPYHGRLITMTGQLFLVDLLEKLENDIELVQSNTDGIIIKILEHSSEEKVNSIIKEWEERTGFTLSLDKIDKIYQRDVNCYAYKQGDYIGARGGNIAHYGRRYIFPTGSEALIVGDATVEYLINDILPEDYIEQHKRDLTLFQYFTKKGEYEWIDLDEIKGDEIITNKLPQHLNRAFASNDTETIRTIYKRRTTGKTLQAKIGNMPNNVFIYNDEINSDQAIDKLIPKIDFQHYINKVYKEIEDFIEIPKIKNLNILF